jgi:hypothetical protein
MGQDNIAPEEHIEQKMICTVTNDRKNAKRMGNVLSAAF